MKTAVRAGIMLSVLVGLPSAWVYYGPLPDKAQQVVDRFVATAKEALDWEQTTASETAPSVATAPQTAASSLAPAALPSTVVTPTPTAPAANPIEPLLARLRGLGVAEYALERWGASGELYRFHCEMPLGPGEGFTQQFEAVAADPRASVEQVVSEVASWHVARSGDTMLR